MARLRLPFALYALVLATGVALAALLAAGARAGEHGAIARVDSIGVTVSDMDRALAFYTGVLPFQAVAETEVDGEAYEHLFGVFGLRARIVRLRLGAEEIELIDYLAPEGRPIPVDSRSNDAWFQHIAIIVSDMEAAYAHLRRHKVQHASSGPQTLPDWNPNAGGIKAFYFKDPDGHHLEILQFPAGKGDPRWQQPGGALFLGIDHTAIVVDDTEASLAFYRDRLGMDVAGESENWGPEQERLNNVFGARLRITALRATGGPGIELLEYLAPGDGRPSPADTRANDLWHWQVSLVTADVAAAAAPLRAGHAPLVSPGAVDLPANGLGLRAGLMARDPDGHALLLVEPLQ
jgi:catechol 2,3-dioxygenase-like lactoylglutathione lyase family enzyme